MATDLNSMSRDELKARKKDLQKDIRAVDRALDSLKDRQKKAALVAAEKAAAEHGFSLSELTKRGRGAAKVSGIAKYRNPSDPDQTWTGKGRRPDWIKSAIEKGGDLSKFEI